jgi:hypothetical protein
MLVVWTIEYTARASQVAFGGPISIAVKERSIDGRCTVRKPGVDEVDKQRNRTRDAAEILRDWYEAETRHSAPKAGTQ